MLGTIKKIGYAGYLSVDFPTFTLITDCNIDNSDNGESSSYLNREPVSSEYYDGSYSPTYRYKWSEKFAPKVTFLKDDFSDFTDDEARKVLRWLTAKSTASYADFYDNVDSNAIAFSALGGWTELQLHKLSNARIVGITATFSAVTPYAMSGLQTITKTITMPQTFTINCDSDEQEALIYPKIIITETGVVVNADHAMTTITEHAPQTVYRYNDLYYWIDTTGVLHSGEAIPPTDWTTTGVIIQNTTLNTTTKVGNNGASEIITLDGANQVVGTNATSRVFGSDFSWNWMPLQRGDNIIKVTGSCTIEFQFRNIIKLGEW